MKRFAGLADALITLPNFAAPEVGFFLLQIFGKNSPVGRYFAILYILGFHLGAAVIASLSYPFPSCTGRWRVAFEELDAIS
jgi:ABC-type molybdate transport system permease subunit